MDTNDNQGAGCNNNLPHIGIGYCVKCKRNFAFIRTDFSKAPFGTRGRIINYCLDCLFKSRSGESYLRFEREN